MSSNELFIIGTIIIVVAFAIFIWRYKISDEERKRISERLNNPNNFKSNHADSEELEKRKDLTSYSFIRFIIILLLASFYFYRVFTSSTTIGFWGYFLIAVLLITGIDAFGDLFKSEKKYHENLQELNKQKKNVEYSQSSFDDFIAGRMSLAKTFWLYGILIGFVLGFLCGYFAEMYEQHWLYIFPFAYYAVVTVAVWNCATLYTKQKLENKQPYGWAIAAKIYMVFNALAVVGQIILVLNAK